MEQLYFAARVILKRSKFTSASDARIQLSWLSLEDFKSVYLRHLLCSVENGSAKPYICALVNHIAKSHSYTTRASSSNHLYMNKVHTKFGKSAISSRLSKLSYT